MRIFQITFALSVCACTARRVQTASENHLSLGSRPRWFFWQRGGGASHVDKTRGNHTDTLEITAAQQKMLQKARGDIKKMEKAYNSFQKKLHADPENIALKIACADAIVSMMRIVGNANALTCHFVNHKREIRKSDTAENKAFWSKWAPVAESLLSDIEAHVGKDVFANEGSTCSMRLESCMYATSSRGIVSAALSGHAMSFLSNLGKLEELHPDRDGAQCYIYRGSYYLAAPFPVYDSKKGAELYELAAKKFPESRRNQYFVAVGRFANGDFTGARSAMEKSLSVPCRSQSEMDICDFLSEEAKRTIHMLSSNGY